MKNNQTASPTPSRQSSWRAESASEPIAIIGLGCRFPGQASDWRRYWHNLDNGVDAISETPPQRWNLDKFYLPGASAPSKTQSKWGGYVSDIDKFDPQLFRIAPREAASMDPQQRMLLEVSYRAIEDAGQPLGRLAGREVAVFAGISSFDYAVAGLSYQDRGVIDAYNNTGGSSSIAANRISYCFDLRGPSVAVDTACSSSLVAMHMACESIWRGDAEMALAGGVNALILPDFYVAFSQLGVLSPDGRCKTFDARANGYVRSEGAGMVLLKPLSQAVRDCDPIYAVVRATALNQDGRTPGMTVPSQAAQEALLRTACHKAAVDPRDIQYVEAHGTGTPIGDPIEANALGSVLGEGRDPNAPCYIGSVKTNIGHLEAGAGIASIIKTALSLHHNRIPAHLHYNSANPAIDFEALKLRVPTKSMPWESKVSRLAGINGFGYGGANGHVILEQAPVQAGRTTEFFPRLPAPAAKQAPKSSTNQGGTSEPADTPVREGVSEHNAFAAPVLLPLSAASQPALADLASQFADFIEQSSPETHLAEIAGFVAHRRTHHGQRVTACAITRPDMIAELRAIAESQPDEWPQELSAAKLAAGTAFILSGQGPQWWAMGRGLLKYSPAFRTVIKQCDREFARYGKWSLMTELMRSESESRMQKTAIAQPSIFAIQVALAAVWESWGVKPSALVGHSVGEIAAAYLSGGLSFGDACCVAFHRGRTMDLASSQGAMLAAGLSASEVAQWIAGMEAEISVAAINGPSSVTISGAKHAIESLAQRLEEEGVFCRRLAVEYAFHSPQMEPVRDELLDALKRISPKPTHTPLISTVTGGEIAGTELDAEYWWKNVRQCVRFSEAMTTLAARGCAVAVEVGPHPVLAYSVNECFAAVGASIKTVASLNRQQDDLQVITKSLGTLYSLGLEIRWSGFYNKPTRRVDLPVYPFQLRRCWSESLESRHTRLATIDHPLLGEQIDSDTKRWQCRIDLKLQRYLSDHVVRGAVMYPAAAMIDAAMAAARTMIPQEAISLRRIRLHNPCTIDESHSQWIQTHYDAERRQVRLAFRDCDVADWQSLATIDISRTVHKASAPVEAKKALGEARGRCNDAFSRQRLYAYCSRIGLDYGGAFQGVLRGVRRGAESVVEVDLSASDLDLANHTLHPSLLDSCFHAMIAADTSFDHSNTGLYLPVEIGAIEFYQALPAVATVHCRMQSKTRRQMICDLDIYDSLGNLCVRISGFVSRRIGAGDPQITTEDLVYSYSWEPSEFDGQLPLGEQGDAANWLILMDEGGIGRELTQRLLERGDRVFEVYRNDSQVPKTTTSKFYQVDAQCRTSFEEALRAVYRDSGEKIDEVVYLWGLDAPDSHLLNTHSLQTSTHLTAVAPMHFVQAWDSLPPGATADLAIITAGAQSADRDPELISVAQGPLIGLGRVIISECAAFRTKLIDIAGTPSAADINCLLQELIADDSEDEIMWRDSWRYIRRFGPQHGKPLTADAVATLPSSLQPGKSAGIEEVKYVAAAMPCELAAEEIEIEVFAAALNFSDVMKALDLYPGMEDGPVLLGAECAGRVTRVGKNSRWKPGDEVVAIAPGSFATHTIVKDALVALKPTKLSFEQACAVPIAFLTADYALNQCAHLQPGDSVLVHSASGGVGLAAVQLAQKASIRVLATAGNQEKRDYLRKAGIQTVMDSRSLEFGQQTLDATGGQGVDAVLNSLPGEAISVGLSVLKTGGRFLEIGKRDIYSDAPLGLYPFRNNLSMHAIDLDQLFKLQPQRMGAMLRSLMKRFESGELQPLPVRDFPASDTVDAFKFMQHGKHIGKVVVRYDTRPQPIYAAEHALQGDGNPFCSDGTYLIAGGLGGFGLEITKWMVAKGARQLVISSRSKHIRPEAQDVIDALRAQGATISVIPADITKAEDVSRVLKHIHDNLPKLVGVVHTAMVLEDKLLVDLDRATLDKVLFPKVLGGWNLHQQTLGLELECFIVFSSLSSVFGHAGQANYSAANALLDSLAYYRRAQGLPGLVMNWGHLGEVGYLAEREQLSERLKRQGVLSFTVKQATDCLEYALATRAIQMSVLRIDWTVWRGLGITNRVSPRFAHLLKTTAHATGTNKLASAAALRAASDADRCTLVGEGLRTKASSLLGVDPESIGDDRALLEMGLDSLMAVEMRNWIEGHMQISLPISILMRSASFGELAQHIAELVGGDVGAPSPTEDAKSSPPNSPADWQQNPETLLESVSEMGSDEVSELLGQLLRERE